MRTRRKPTLTDRDPDLDADINDLIREVVPDPDAWKNAPNPVLGMSRPVDLIGTPREPILRDLLRAAKQGSFS